ncbi:MAG: hypothetical protein ACRD1Y_02640 [Terriglobales bacterium]
MYSTRSARSAPVNRMALAASTALPRTLPSAAGRDHAVDMIKGLACLLMVVAHVPLPHAPWLDIGTEAAVLFFASTGMNFWHIAARSRGDEARIAANGLFLIFAGFANNYVNGTLTQADVFQSAGMAMLAMLALRWLLPRFWTWLFPIPYLIHYLNAHVYFWKISAGGVSSFFLAPGLFPLLPWLSFYLLGAHLKRYPSRRMRLGVGLVALVAFGAVDATRGFEFDKFWMSADYWLLGLAYASLLLELFRTWLARRRRTLGRAGAPDPAPVRSSAGIPWAELRYWGGNSLVFYILQSLVIRVLELWLPHGLGLLAASLALTALLLRAGLALQAWAKRVPAWPVLAACVLLSAAVLALEAWVFHGFLIRTYTSFVLTLTFVAAYPAFKNLSARLPRAAAHAAQQKPVA